ncbi:MAG: ABC transporter permease [Muribaculaceae bacterium]|nr:ABC transporter permease [Muribaculaceae bacterium]
MIWEWFIARRLALRGTGANGSLSLTIAQVGIVLSLVVMILAITIVTGFKDEVSGKIYNLDAHVKITNSLLGNPDQEVNTINYAEVANILKNEPTISARIKNVSLVVEKSAVIKTDSDFCGVICRGVDNGFNWDYFSNALVDGRLPKSSEQNEVIISRTIARKMNLGVGDRVYAYFIDDRMRARRPVIVGVYNTDFETFDETILLCNIALLQGVNGWNRDTGNYVAVNLRDVNNIWQDSHDIYSALSRHVVNDNLPSLFNVSNTQIANQQFFSWLGMLDMNVVVILTLMMIVAMFTLVAALLMIVLERIRLIGVLKAQGATNGAVRRVFLLLTGKLILSSVIIGNVLGLGLAWIQKHFHILALDPEAYYMPWVSITINPTAILLLNLGVILVSYLTLIAPSHIISSIKPTTTLRYE